VLQLSRMLNVLSLVSFSQFLLLLLVFCNFTLLLKVSLNLQAGRPRGRRVVELFTSPRMAGVRDGRIDLSQERSGPPDPPLAFSRCKRDSLVSVTRCIL
jgi:hypothetical protein